MKNKVLFTDVVWFQEGPGIRLNQYTSTGIKLLNVSNLINGKIDLSTSDRYISKEEAYGKYKHFLVDENDFIIASSGIKVDYFEKKMGFVPKKDLPLCMNTSTIRFKSLNKTILDIRYFMYFLKSNEFKRQLNKQITGSAQLNFGPSHLKKMFIPLIPLLEQKKIVNILDKINSLINIQEDRIKAFDLLVKSRFTELFGDICKNNKQWNIINLGDLFKVSSSKRIYQNEHMKKGVPFFRIADLMKKISTGSCSTEIFISDNKYNELKNSGYVPKSGDILLTSRGTLGECYVITKDDKFYFQDGMISWLSPIDKNININYIVHLFCMPEFKKQFSNHTSGSTVDYLSIENIRRLRIPLPNNNLQNKFDKDVHKIDKSKIADLITFLLRLNLKLLRLIFELLGRV